VLNNRVTAIAHRIISPYQSAFIPGQFILDGVVTLHETLHELQTKKKDAVVLKLDFEKAYDKIKWHFLQQALRIKGFSPMWCEWIHKVMSKGSVKVNDVVGRYFQTCKGVCQGDPLSPILLNLAVDVLAKLIDRVKVNGQIKRIVPHLVDDRDKTTSEMTDSSPKIILGDS
jgi:retron-type reverse transcriptase